MKGISVAKTVPQKSVWKEAVSELSRRRVFRVAGAYTVAGWLVVEMSSVVFPALEFPDWLLRAVIYGAIGGFPVVIMLAWIFDITPAGVVITRDDGMNAEVRRAARVIEGIIVLVFVSVVAAAGYFHYAQRTSTASEALPSIAVLPFSNLSDDPENEYFSDGVAEEILNALVKLERLQVAARTSSFAFKELNRNVREIGEELNVDYVLEGSVRRAGNRLRVTVQLINVEDGFHVWSENYERTMNDVFAIQDEIASSIAAALKVQLVDQAEQSLVNTKTESDEAYNLYLLGRYQWNNRTPQALARAVDLFEQAIEIDDEFALAYSGLADAYLLLSTYGSLPVKAARLKAEPAIAEALRLDKSIAEPYASLGLLHMLEQDFGRAEQLLRAAIELNPNYATAHHWLGLVLRVLEGPLAARAEFTRALELDPLNARIIQNLAESLATLGRYDEAVMHWEKLFRTHDGRLAPFYFQAVVDAQESGALREMLAFAEAALNHDDDDEMARAVHAFAQIVVKRNMSDSLRVIEEAWQRSNNNQAILNILYLSYAITNNYGDIISVHANNFASTGETGTVSDPNQAISLAWAGASASVLGQHHRAVQMLEPFAENAVLRLLLDPIDRWLFLSNLAWSYEKLGRQDDATRLVERGLEAISAAMDQGWDTPRVYGLQAVLLELSGDRVAAMRSLKIAYDKGWTEWWWISSDPRLKELRGYETFREIVTGMDRRIEAILR